ncbi:MAG: hypothetical protein A2828_00685 [Candidatus Terrybacteria bacterium RIFCSPHIGHO2_01_FULL_43_35]|uniref:Uncharacterized protein n=1 Tax=Candidatus Terrybacteria bacterium RIFCSPHIGHO2_01_FULL_43_35 TaxID=1802361 RepID=A0A1G2PEK6_9BACT|nr:MAG: hypothetical protein A2828_00685 [Candidatus Terrybacteria bacterium RIFCSPHIGHO2_01_FULL_43_35]
MTPHEAEYRTPSEDPDFTSGESPLAHKYKLKIKIEKLKIAVRYAKNGATNITFYFFILHLRHYDATTV